MKLCHDDFHHGGSDRESAICVCNVCVHTNSKQFGQSVVMLRHQTKGNSPEFSHT